MAKVLFTRCSGIGSAIIRGVTWSDWSHVQLIDGSKLLGSSFPYGVVEETLEHRLSISDKAAIVEIPTNNDTLVFEYIKSQLGKPYDLIGAIGLAVHRDWQEEDSWWCSELIAAAILIGGTKLFRDNSFNRITPQHLFMLPYEISYIK